MTRINERRCLCCSDLFTPDYRNRNRQEYCAKPECRTASKAASQRRWLDNNPDYFKSWIHVDRARKWRQANPDRRRRPACAPVLQETCDPIPPVKQEVKTTLPPAAQASSAVLQDFCMTQHPVFVGLIAYLTGCVLQDEFDAVTRRLAQLGHDVRGTKSNPGESYAPQTAPSSRPPPNRAPPVQLGGSPVGP